MSPAAGSVNWTVEVDVQGQKNGSSRELGVIRSLEQLDDN